MIEKTRTRAVHHLKIIGGQISGLRKMVNNHISEHIIPMLSATDEVIRGKAQAELLAMYELHNRRG